MPTKRNDNAEPVRRSSRSKRIRYNLAEDLDHDDLESLLAEHERKGQEYRAKRDAKSSKPEEDKYVWKHPGYDIPLDSLPALCIERIFSYVSDPQDLYNLAFTSNFLMSLVTPPLVIRSAVFHNLRKRDTRHRKTLSNIMSYLSNRSIHIPSAHRLLRLLNAKKCERGDNCWGKNLLTGKPMALDTTLACRPFGLAICDKCIKFGTTNVPYSHFSRIQKGVAFYQWNKLMDPQIDPVTGQRHGSLVRVIELQQIESSFDSQEDRKEALESVVERAISAGGAYCPRHYEEKAASYVEAFEIAEKEAEIFIRAEQARADKLYNERREEKVAKKVARVRAIFDLFDEYLADCPRKELAMNCTWREDDLDCLKFNCTIVEQAMKHLVSAPSSASDRQIRDAAAGIREAFTALEDKEFFSFSFISENSHRYKKGLYEYCTTEATPLTIMTSNLADQTFISLVEQNQLTKALIRVLNCHNCSALSRSFALAVVRTNQNAAESQDRIEHYRSLAEKVWKKKVSTTSYAGASMTVGTIKESYNTCLEEYKILKKNARDYLASEQTREFLSRDAANQQGDFTRQMALDQVFSPSTIDQYLPSQQRRLCAYDALKNRNFDHLRILHEAYFLRPNHYSLNM